MSYTWEQRSWAAINRAHKECPVETSLADRIKIIDAAYPFGSREYFPYKAWLKARKKYLWKYGYRGRAGTKVAHLSPLERMMARVDK